MPGRIRIAVPPALAALIAASIGLFSCYSGMGVAESATNVAGSHTAFRTLIILLPFLVGALVTGLIYRLLTIGERSHAPATTHDVEGARASSTPVTGGRRSSGARYIVFWLCGISMTISAFLFGTFAAMGGDGGTPATTGEAISQGFGGVVFGLFFGLLLGGLVALPAAVIVRLTRREKPVKWTAVVPRTSTTGDR